ncbi:XRE family transcriptional regulator [Plantactinospora sp. WMMB334]|uniref:XRE family transcriptional regulator n=1 Tax=Plantactinospora sp. WMMB334 TaxID=3404119 RepID=UPI003B934C59
MLESDTLQDPGVQLRLRALLRATANDLKRPDEVADTDLRLPPGTFTRLVDGHEPITWELLAAAAAVWPVNVRDLLPLHDDTNLDVRICRASDSTASERTIARGGTAYYTYRDTAMSRLASYRPEWIGMLCTVGDNYWDNPAVQWNSGHLLYQFTYMVGKVNYYYRWNGRSYCIPMNTGDSVFGLPFAPHSFTRRDAGEPAHILALTYGGDLTGDPQRELAVLGGDAAQALTFNGAGHGQAALLASFLQARMLGPAELAARSGIEPLRVDALLTGKVTAAVSELAPLAAALRVHPRELLPITADASADGVVVQRAVDARRWQLGPQQAPAYDVVQLAGDRLHPHTTAVELHPRSAEPDGPAWLSTYQHQYVYVLGDKGTQMTWTSGDGQHHAALAPGDSVYLKPLVPVAFFRGGRLLVLRIGGAVRPDVRFALGAMADDGRHRYVRDTHLWYSLEGKR